MTADGDQVACRELVDELHAGGSLALVPGEAEIDHLRVLDAARACAHAGLLRLTREHGTAGGPAIADALGELYALAAALEVPRDAGEKAGIVLRSHRDRCVALVPGALLGQRVAGDAASLCVQIVRNVDHD